MPRPTRTRGDERGRIADRILRAWRRRPDLPLGQFLGRATGGASLEFVDDETIATVCELFASRPAAHPSYACELPPTRREGLSSKI